MKTFKNKTKVASIILLLNLQVFNVIAKESQFTVKAAVQETKMTASNLDDYNYFGKSVSISGNRALIGAPGSNTADSPYSGFAYIFESNNSNWTESQVLSITGSDADKFGESVALLGDRAVIGAPGDDTNGTDTGMVYIFEFDNGIWSQVTALSADVPIVNEEFGSSVSLNNNRIIIGAAKSNTGGPSKSGAVYIFDLNAGTWSQSSVITPSAPIADAYFGHSVSLFGNKLLVGAPSEFINGSSYTGLAYVFELVAGNWSEAQLLNGNASNPHDYFGNSVSLSATHALIGAPGEDSISGDNTGSVYMFDLSNYSSTHITPINQISFGSFGYAVALEQNRALIGSNTDNGNAFSAGSAFVFDKIGANNTWQQVDKIVGDSVPEANFGGSVALSNDKLLIGSFGNIDTDFSEGYYEGSAYSFYLDLIFNNGFEAQ